MDGSEQRRALQRLIEEEGGDYAGLSRLLGKNPAYIQQFIKRGSPRRLAAEDRRTIAEFFGVDPSRLGVPAADSGFMVTLGRMAVRASAGGGAFADAEDRAGGIAFDPVWLRRIGADPATHELIAVEGDSMEPVLSHGDDIMVDRTASARPLRDGIHVIRMDGTLMVKRLARAPGGKLSVLSDNRDYPSYEALAPDAVQILGRVVWAGRRL